MIGVRSIGTEQNTALAIRRADIVEHGVKNFTFDLSQLVVSHQSETNSALDTSEIAQGQEIGAVGAFDRNTGNQVLEFKRLDNTFQDTQTNSKWNILGFATSGELAETQLNPYEYLDTFWFSWVRFNPETQILAIS